LTSNPEYPAECIPLFIFHKDLPPSIETKVGSHLDIAPTILDLLDIPEPSGWLGTSLFFKGKNTVLFNDLTVIELNDNTPQKKIELEYQPFVDYSNSIVE
jgi:arylsulfatase A-like enzyme